MSFPASPADGETIDGPGGIAWLWDGAKWTFGPSSVGIAVPTDDLPPLNPDTGDLWFNTIDSQLYIFDTDQDQWIAVKNQPSLPGLTGPIGPMGPTSLPAGITDGSDALPGQVGEYLELVIPENTNYPELTTINFLLQLSAGDWEVGGYLNLTSNGTGFNTMTGQWIPSVGGVVWQGSYFNNPAFTGFSVFTMTYPIIRVNAAQSNLSVTMSIGVSMPAGSTWGVVDVNGSTGLIWARRIR